MTTGLVAGRAHGNVLVRTSGTAGTLSAFVSAMIAFRAV
jgi:hypothetical protein